MLTHNRNSKLFVLTLPEAQYFSRHSYFYDFNKKNCFSLIHSKKFDKLYLVEENKNHRLANTTLAASCLTIGMTHPTDLSTRQPSLNR